MPLPFPDGRYLSASGVVRTNKGGQTGAMLMRSRAITQAIGAPVDVLCFDPSTHYDQVREQFVGAGLLTDGMRLLNMYEHYRDAGWGEETGSGEGLPALAGVRPEEVSHPDGSPWKTAWRNPAGEVVVNDFRRRDGSVYLRTTPYTTVLPETLPRNLLRVGSDGEVLGAFGSLKQWYHRWIKDLTFHDQRTFLFMDSRYLVPILAPIDDPSVHLIYTLHNCHVPRPRTWNTPPKPDYLHCLERIADVDAFVTLTDRQRQDIQLQWGTRTNLDVVPNPVDLPDPPEPAVERDRHRVVVVARLEKQKRLRHAILVFQQVIKKIPDARLDIYGSGKEKDGLQGLIDELGLGAHVTLRGHDSRARESLWTASAFLLTSENEGYPLATLESLSRGCPVVSYDIPYGPREQISDGVDGFLVGDSDISAAADRVVELLSTPELVQRMGAAGREKAKLHDREAFLDDWARVLSSALERAPRRTTLRSVELTLVVTPSGPARLRLPTSQQARQLSGRLRIKADNRGEGAEHAELALVAIDLQTGERARLPLRQVRTGLDYNFEAAVGEHDTRAALPAARAVELRLQFTWENAYWDAIVPAAHAGLPDPEQAPPGIPEAGRMAAVRAAWRRQVPPSVRGRVSQARTALRSLVPGARDRARANPN